MYSGGSGLSIDIHFVDIELSYDVLSPLPIVLSKHFNHPHPYIEIATAISDTCTFTHTHITHKYVTHSLPWEGVQVQYTRRVIHRPYTCTHTKRFQFLHYKHIWHAARLYIQMHIHHTNSWPGFHREYMQ